MLVHLATTEEIVRVEIDDKFRPTTNPNLPMTCYNVNLLDNLWKTCENITNEQLCGQLKAIYSADREMIMFDW